MDEPTYYILLDAKPYRMERSVYIRTRPCCDNLGKSSARTRQTAQYSMKMAYTRGPIALALDRRISDIPLDGRLQSRTSNLVAWTKTMLSVIRDSISDARKQLRTGHQDIRTYFSDTAALERTMNVTLTTAIVATLPHTALTLAQPPFARDSADKNPAALTSTDIRRSRHHDIRTYFSATTAAEPIKNATQATTEELTDSQYFQPAARLSRPASASKVPAKYDFNRPSGRFYSGAQQLQLSLTELA
jgi:hypothetical protein